MSDKRTYRVWSRKDGYGCKVAEVEADRVDISGSTVAFYLDGQMVYACVSCPTLVEPIPKPDPMDQLRDDIQADELESLGVDPEKVAIGGE